MPATIKGATGKPTGKRRKGGKPPKQPSEPKADAKDPKPSVEIQKVETQYLPSPYTMTQEQVNILANVVCKGATRDELALVAHVAQKTRLDPLRKQLWAWKEMDRCPTCRPKWNSQQNRYIGDPKCTNCKGDGRVSVLRLFTGKDGFLAIAHRHGDMEEFDSACVFYGDSFSLDRGKGEVHHVEAPPKERGQLYAAWCRTKRRDRTRASLTVIYYGEYRKFWARRRNSVAEEMPTVMLGKAVIAVHLRQEYPEDLSDLYAPEEFGGRFIEGQVKIPEQLAPGEEGAPEDRGDQPPPAHEKPESLMLKDHKCKRCDGIEYLVQTAGDDAKNPGKKYLTCASCTEFGGWHDDIMMSKERVKEAKNGGAPEYPPDGLLVSNEGAMERLKRKHDDPDYGFDADPGKWPEFIEAFFDLKSAQGFEPDRCDIASALLDLGYWKNKPGWTAFLMANYEVDHLKKLSKVQIHEVRNRLVLVLSHKATIGEDGKYEQKEETPTEKDDKEQKVPF